jgi:membrane-bound metal-dependent hydrolase YbcI (DUF457 family)
MVAGVAAGWLVAGTPSLVSGPRVGALRWREAAFFGVLGALPDVDLLFGAHSGPTHSVGAAVVAAVIAAMIGWRIGVRGVSGFVLVLACAAAYGSHAVLDWLSTDASPPIGIMALWPFDAGYYESDLHLFMAISRRYYQGWAFVRQNVLALLRELTILMPLLIVTVRYRPRRRG